MKYLGLYADMFFSLLILFEFEGKFYSKILFFIHFTYRAICSREVWCFVDSFEAKGNCKKCYDMTLLTLNFYSDHQAKMHFSTHTDDFKMCNKHSHTLDILVQLKQIINPAYKNHSK